MLVSSLIDKIDKKEYNEAKIMLKNTENWFIDPEDIGMKQ